MIALDDLSFSVRPGEVYGFVGSNGAGKSTAMRIALGVLIADSGQVRYGDRPMDDDTRRLIGYMPEERGLYAKEKIADQLIFFARLHGLAKPAAKRNTLHYSRDWGWGNEAATNLMSSAWVINNGCSWRPRWSMTRSC